MPHALSLSEAIALADAAPGVHEAAAALRAHFAPLRVVVVDAVDMRDETPAASGARWHLFLGASDGHCWTMTDNPHRAAALFIAARG